MIHDDNVENDNDNANDDNEDDNIHDNYNDDELKGHVHDNDRVLARPADGGFPPTRCAHHVASVRPFSYLDVRT